jgi:hypothetical protein
MIDLHERASWIANTLGLAQYGRITDDCREHIVGEVSDDGRRASGRW